MVYEMKLLKEKSKVVYLIIKDVLIVGRMNMCFVFSKM